MSIQEEEERWIDCYKSSHKILLVGEGDFSFSACLARAFRTANNIVATTYLDKDWLIYKHPTSVPHLEELERFGCLLLYNVDVYDMNTHPILKNMKFDIIIFNFPHAGHFNLSEYNFGIIKKHKELVGAYFRSASKMLSDGGEVHIRHRDDPPYNRWKVVLLAAKAGLKLKEKVSFYKWQYPGYHNKRGGDIKTNKTFPIVCAFTFKFTLDLPKIDDYLPMNAKVHDDVVEREEVHYDLMKKDEVYDIRKEYGVHDDLDVHVLEMKDHVNGHHKKTEIDDDLPMNAKVHDDLIPNEVVHDDLVVKPPFLNCFYSCIFFLCNYFFS